MKKLLKIFSLGLAIFTIFTCFSSADSCISKDLGNNTICVNIEKTSSTKYTLNRTINCRDNSCAVSCRILLPDNTQVPVGTCNGSFYYDSNSSERIKLYISINSVQKTIEGYYNFRNGSWGNIVDNGGDDEENDYIKITTNNKNPSTSEYIRLTIDTDNDYTNKVYLSAQYRSSTSNSWSTISNTSSTYFSNYSDERENGYYKMRSSDDGHKVLSNLLKFSKKGYYRITAKDVEGNISYIDFNVGNSSTNTNNSDVKLSANKTTPNTSEYIKLTIDTDEDYDGKINFYKVQYRSSSSSSWTTISRTSSTYFSNYCDEWEQGYYKMKYSDYGRKTISNFLKFVKKGYYRIYAQDVDGNYDYIDFNVGGSSNNDYDLELSTNDKNPTTSEYIDLTIETDEDYVGKVYLSAKYRSTSSDNWSSISNTSSTYFSNRSTNWSNGYISLTSSNNGYKKISDAFKFAKKGYYRIIAEDEDGNTDYVDFEVGNNSSSYSNDEIEISASTTYPNVGSYITLTIDTDRDYVGNISFYKVQYRSSNSDAWTTISSRTNSTYFSNYSDEWEQGYYKMKSTDNGHKVISSFLKFAKKGYYRIYAKDTEDNTDYIDFHVGNTTYYDDYLDLSTNDTRPYASEYVDLTVNTDSSYRGEINFSAQYRSSTSNNWNNISTTSSTYFISRSTTWNNGFLNMTSSDRGEKTVENIFKFAKKGYYRIIATDEYGNSTYLDFNVGNPNSSTLEGFTQKEYDMVEKIHTIWPTLINKLKSEYPRLKNNSTWRNLSDDLYDNMGDVVDKKTNRIFKDYDDFDTAFRYRLTRTQNLID